MKNRLSYHHHQQVPVPNPELGPPGLPNLPHHYLQPFLPFFEQNQMWMVDPNLDRRGISPVHSVPFRVSADSGSSSRKPLRDITNGSISPVHGTAPLRTYGGRIRKPFNGSISPVIVGRGGRYHFWRCISSIVDRAARKSTSTPPQSPGLPIIPPTSPTRRPTTTTIVFTPLYQVPLPVLNFIHLKPRVGLANGTDLGLNLLVVLLSCTFLFHGLEIGFFVFLDMLLIDIEILNIEFFWVH